MQQIMNALRISYDIKESPPVLYCERLGAAGQHAVCEDQLLPRELISKSWVLRDPVYCEHFCRACRARIALENTYERPLRRELKQDMHNGPLQIVDIMDTIKFMVQFSASWHILALFAVNHLLKYYFHHFILSILL